jgi:hypothetical protein
MMVLGMPGLNAAQNRLHLALWAISGAPLLIGADLTRLDAESLAALTNAEAIRVDQDKLGLQAIKVAELGPGLEVWSKFLTTPGERAVLLLNRTYFPAPMSVKWTELGLAGDTATVREVWTARDLGSVKSSYDQTVPAQDGVLLIVKGTEGGFRHYEPATKQTHDELAIHDVETRFTGVSALEGEWAQVRITYANSGAEPRLAELRVNGQVATGVAFPPTGADKGSVWVQAHLDRPGTSNLLNFAMGAAEGVKIDSIDVH